MSTPDSTEPGAARLLRDAVAGVQAGDDVAARAVRGWRRRRDRRRTAAAAGVAAVVGLGGVGAVVLAPDRPDVALPAGVPAGGDGSPDAVREGLRLDRPCDLATVRDTVGALSAPGTGAPDLAAGWATDGYGLAVYDAELAAAGAPEGAVDVPDRAEVGDDGVRGVTVLCFFDGTYVGPDGTASPGSRGVTVSFDPLYARPRTGSPDTGPWGAGAGPPPPPGAAGPSDDVGTWGSVAGRACLADAGGLVLVLVEEVLPDRVVCLYRSSPHVTEPKDRLGGFSPVVRDQAGDRVPAGPMLTYPDIERAMDSALSRLEAQERRAGPRQGG